MTKDYAAYAAKDITPTMEAFAEWLTKETGYAVDARTVALAGSLRADFQSSEFWKADPRNYKANIEAKAQERLVKAQEAAAKAIERAKAAEAKAKEAAAAAKAKADAAVAKAKEEAKTASKAA